MISLQKKKEIICVSDLHFHTANVLETEEFIEKLISFLKPKRNDISFLLILGDTFHTHEWLHLTPYNRGYELFSEIQDLGIPLIVLVGNHDMLDATQFLTKNHAFNFLKKWSNVWIVDFPLHISCGENNFLCVPFVPKGRFIEALKLADIDFKTVDIIFAHQEFRNALMESLSSSLDGDEWNTNFPIVISGHIHNYQILDNIFYPGSTIQHSFKDKTKKGVWSLTINSEIEFSIVNLGLRKKKLLVFNVDQFFDFLKTNSLAKYKYKFEIHDFKANILLLKKNNKYKQIIQAKEAIFSFVNIDVQDTEMSQLSLRMKQKTYYQILEELLKEQNLYTFFLEITN